VDAITDAVLEVWLSAETGNVESGIVGGQSTAKRGCLVEQSNDATQLAAGEGPKAGLAETCGKEGEGEAA
jgi:hypothetical protein